MSKTNANILKLFRIALEVSECTENHCAQHKKNIMANKTAAALYVNYRGEKDINKKLKLGEQYSKNDLMYEYNKCIMKHCNKLLNDLMKVNRLVISTIPHSNPKRKILDKLIDELEPLSKKKQLTRKEYKIYLKNIAELMFTIKQST